MGILLQDGDEWSEPPWLHLGVIVDEEEIIAPGYLSPPIARTGEAEVGFIPQDANASIALYQFFKVVGC